MEVINGIAYFQMPETKYARYVQRYEEALDRYEEVLEQADYASYKCEKKDRKIFKLKQRINDLMNELDDKEKMLDVAHGKSAFLMEQNQAARNQLGLFLMFVSNKGLLQEFASFQVANSQQAHEFFDTTNDYYGSPASAESPQNDQNSMIASKTEDFDSGSFKESAELNDPKESSDFQSPNSPCPNDQALVDYHPKNVSPAPSAVDALEKTATCLELIPYSMTVLIEAVLVNSELDAKDALPNNSLKFSASNSPPLMASPAETKAVTYVTSNVASHDKDDELYPDDVWDKMSIAEKEEALCKTLFDDYIPPPGFWELQNQLPKKIISESSIESGRGSFSSQDFNESVIIEKLCVDDVPPVCQVLAHESIHCAQDKPASSTQQKSKKRPKYKTISSFGCHLKHINS